MAITPDLFSNDPGTDRRAPREAIGAQACVLPGFARAAAPALWRDIAAIAGAAPFRHMHTPGGQRMSVATTSCGDRGWITDRHGYRYVPDDPESGQPWPAMPLAWQCLARDAAAAAGFDGFAPDTCLINRYVPGTRMSLHQDRDEHDFGAPIVSVSLGIAAVFLFGGDRRADKAQRVPLQHGDVVVWGGVDRLRFHGVLPLREDLHPLLGAQRINLTFRRAG